MGLNTFFPIKTCTHLLLVPIYIKDGSVRRTETMLGISTTQEI